jgi:hypothetical protein
MKRTYLLVSALEPEAAARVTEGLPQPIDLVVTSPTERARDAAARAVGGRWVSTVDEPLLAPRALDESGGDVLCRIAQALRGLRAYEAKAPLVVLDGLDVLGASVFLLDEEGVMRCADDLERVVPLP